MKPWIYVCLFSALFFNCSNDDNYKNVLDQYVKDNIELQSKRRQFQVSDLRVRAEEQPEDFTEFYNQIVLLDSLVSNFENAIISLEDKDTLNSELEKFKINLTNSKIDNTSMMVKELLDFEFLDDSSEKYNWILKLNYLNYNRNMLMTMTGGISHLSTYNSKLLASRLNDSVVVLTVFSRAFKTPSKLFDNSSLSVEVNKKTASRRYIGYNYYPSTSVATYLVESYSDSLFVDSQLQTNSLSEMIVSKNSSFFKVGELKEFDENFIKDYFKALYD
ncbi:MAG: hypothetical protein HRU50_14735 [Winogradskyella sp.]|uniref:hypothetical protein n=1 Tax=Winogradskyella sp. TaxID=1883156 RepID=UPI0025FA68A7|nr:hypothetical protein [Winogradskyella sp.]NRB61181.1 hypothetical protein [Winogradskyella sp.]